MSLIYLLSLILFIIAIDWTVILANPSDEALTSNEMVFGDEAFGK